ncbi:acetoin dehydrogenase dihydrolipoyllysine-residue acetyltransferase subunit [Pseudochrobactrum sp. AO18b]|uniref:acetoin dehydrogenase dihydrolipoyllysine-residue acetyltransferase subunit n=1 Tax=Pseudochrobactrum sp. AO18b TaxID=1201036 RepID=UPI0003A53D61|nr:acetoin dehydrogenase dihydrolipoyllysine-residue acetyltransferase subunit [Pseudochrobactrum sp. AO18b]
MAVEVILPKVDMDMETGQISRWYAKDGDTVTKGQLLFEIETDKAAMEVDAPASGILGDVSAAEGAVVPVGQAVAWIYAEGEERKAASKPVSEPAVEPQISPSVSEAPAVQPVVTPAPVAQTEIAGIRATPLARRLAKDAGLDLSAVQGSGPKGRIQKKDIESNLAAAAPAASPVQATVPRPVVTSPAQAALNAVWLRQGESGQLPIVLIHGFASDLNSWRMLLAGGTLRNPVLALDLPAHGGSPRYVPESIDAIAASVEATLAAHGVEACILVGHSMGGAVAAVTAARGIADVRSLVLISSAGLGPQINGAFLNGLVQAKSEASIVPWLKELFADENMLSRAFINATVAQAQDTELREAQAGMAAHLCADNTQTFEIRSSLEGLAIPVRLIFGAQDRIIPVAHAHGLPGEVGVHVFRNCGHMPQLEQRDAVLRIISECSRAAQ